MPIMALVIKRNGDALHDALSWRRRRFPVLMTALRKAHQYPHDQSLWSGRSPVGVICADAEDTGKKNMRVARIDARSTRPSISRLVWRTCWRLAAVLDGGAGQFNAGPAHQFYDVLGLMIWPMLALAWMFNIVERVVLRTAAFARCWRKRRW